MGCKACGAQDLDKLFGSCLRCTIISGVSSAFFWGIYVLAEKLGGSKFLILPLVGFSSVVTVLFLTHLLGHADNIRRGASDRSS